MYDRRQELHVLTDYSKGGVDICIPIDKKTIELDKEKRAFDNLKLLS